MPLALRELQESFARHLLSDDQLDLVATIEGDTITAASRLAVHRHNLFASLAAALASTFPTVQRLVGEDCFCGLARAFAGQALPLQPVLGEYGQEFAAFIATSSPAAAIPYLADIARLEWVLSLAFNSPYEARLDKEGLAALPVEELPGRPLGLTAGTAIVRSAYPIDRIWKAGQEDAPDDKVDFGAGAVALLVLRQAEDSAFAPLDEGEAAFLAALATGRTLEQATEAAFAAQPDFDLPATFPRLLALGVFAAMQHDG
jgi:hypothetical protein